MPCPSPDQSHASLVESQFGPQAEAYVQSAVHAAGADLDDLEAVARETRPDRALDLGCGGGHVAYRLAAHAREVVACDLSAEMLAAVSATAAARGLSGIVTEQAPAERLPFADGAFDLVASRFSAHHWRDFEAGLREARRVARPGAAAVFVDVVAPGAAMLDTHLQAVELLRDPSHVRDYAAGQWTAAVEAAGFTLERSERRRLRMDFASWTERMRTPPQQRQAIRALQAGACEEVRRAFEIQPDGAFTVDVLFLRARA